MASKKWIILPGGRLKRWKQAHATRRQIVPPRWYRNALSRRDRRLAQAAVNTGTDQTHPYVHPHCASWFW